MKIALQYLQIAPRALKQITGIKKNCNNKGFQGTFNIICGLNIIFKFLSHEKDLYIFFITHPLPDE